MKHIGMEYQLIDACLKDHIIYHKEQKNVIECPRFHTSRYRDDQVTKDVSQDSLLYPNYSTS